MKGEKFICECCRKECTKTVTEEEVLKEKEDLFPDVPIEECAIVCDDCFKNLTNQ